MKHHEDQALLPLIPVTGWTMPTEFPSLAGQGMIAIDVETHDPELTTRGSGANRDGFICGVAVGTEAGFRRYYPVRHQMGDNLDRGRVFDWLRHELKRPVPKIGANILYDLTYFDSVGIDVAGPFYDVQVAEPLLNENLLSYSLDNLAYNYLQERKNENEMKLWLRNAFGRGEKFAKGNIWRAPAAVVGPYAEGDVDLPLRIFALQEVKLKRQSLWDLFLLESRLLPLLLAMWKRGVRVDLTKAQQTHTMLADQQATTLAQLQQLTGIEPDIWSGERLAKLFDAVDVDYPTTPVTGKPSFTKEWLAACAHPAGQLVRTARHLDKVKGTFIQGFVLDKNVRGRLHASFHPLRADRDDGGQRGTVSGRFSSSTPNLQQIPVRDELGTLIRSIFIPERDQRWWKFDWSQIEFRIAIHHAARLKLKGAADIAEQFRISDVDYHSIVAGITGLSRKYAKNINFGILYGLGRNNLGAYLRGFGSDVSDDDAVKMYDEYIRRLPFVDQLRRLAATAAERDGQIVTGILGRKRRFDVWQKGQHVLQKWVPGATRAFTHKALNARIQGDAADIMKAVMVKSWEDGIFAEGVLGAPHLTVHDELDGSYPQEIAAQQGLRELKNVMESTVSLLVPIKADGGTGPDWGSIT